MIDFCSHCVPNVCNLDFFISFCGESVKIWTERNDLSNVKHDHYKMNCKNTASLQNMFCCNLWCWCWCWCSSVYLIFFLNSRRSGQRMSSLHYILTDWIYRIHIIHIMDSELCIQDDIASNMWPARCEHCAVASCLRILAGTDSKTDSYFFVIPISLRWHLLYMFK